MSRLPALLALHEADPADPDLHFMIALEHVAEGRHAEALAWIEKYVAIGTDVGAGWRLAADCHEALDQPSEARQALEQGISASLRAGHPTMARELRERLAGD